MLLIFLFFSDSTVETMPAPGGGPLMLFMLSVLENYTLSEFNQSDPLFYHRLIEVQYVVLMCAKTHKRAHTHKQTHIYLYRCGNLLGCSAKENKETY